MKDQRIELAPYALYTLAAGALMVSWAAWELRPPAYPRHAAAAPRGAAAHPQPLPAEPVRGARASSWQVAAEPARVGRAPRYRPVLHAVGQVPADYVRRVPGPIVAPVLGRRRPTAALVAMPPARPLWRAGDARPWLVLGHDPLRLANRAGYWAARLPADISGRVELGRLISRLAAAAHGAEPPLIRSPESLSGTPRVGAGDRLAMARGDVRGARPDLTIRQRESLDDLLPRYEVEEPTGARPDTLLRAQLGELLGDPATCAWAALSLRQLDLLTLNSTISACEHQAAADRFHALADEGLLLADALPSSREQVNLRKACYAITRRAGVWQIAKRLEQRDAPLAVSGGRERRAARLKQFASTDTGAAYGDGWRRHLGIILGQTRDDGPPQGNRTSSELRAVVATGALAAMAGDVTLAAIDPIDVQQLVNDLELYEAQPRPGLAERIAMRSRELRRSGSQGEQRLAEEIDQNYRNANLRVAIAGALLERNLPPVQVDSRPVNDTVAGVPVTGAAQTQTRLGLSLTPDPHAWRINIEARGSVASRTVASGGPASLQTQGLADFVAVKPVLVHRGGVRAYAAECSTSSEARLLGVQTRYDGVPLVSGLVRSRALDAYRQNERRAEQETELRISSRVSGTLDTETDAFLAALQQRYEREVLARAAALGLRVDPIEFCTTRTRLIARLRFAGDNQLGSHTPRNRAPADSLASVQVHESLVNNALESLDLGRAPMTPREMADWVRDRLSLAGGSLESDSPADGRDVVLKLAAQQPARVRLHEGRVELVLAFEELRVDRAVFSDFIIHADYAPLASLDGLWLEQAETVQIEGRMRSSRRAQLHAVFGGILPPGRRVKVAVSTPEQRQRMSGLMVTQVVVDDGWLGLALGPERPERVALERRWVR